MHARTVIRGLLYSLAGVVLLAVFSVCGLLAFAWLEHRTPLELPTPSGPYSVGRTTFFWVDQQRTDELPAAPDTKEELVAWVWYPSVAVRGLRAEYLPPRWREALKERSGVLMSDFLTRDLSQVRVHSTENSKLSMDQRVYPVVILRAGGSALVTGFTALAEELASHGYVVVGFDAPYRTSIVVLPDGRVVSQPSTYNLEAVPETERAALAERLMRMWTADIAFAIEKLARLNDGDPSGRFTGRLDLTHLGVLGHSLGGATAADFCHEDSRCKAGIDLDGQLLGPVAQEGLRQPFMFLLEDIRHANDATSRDILDRIESMYERLPTDSRIRLTVAGANHFSFSDQILLKSPFLLRAMRGMGAIGALEGRRGLSITGDYVRTFFDVYLKGYPRASLDALARKYPEVSIR